MNMCRQQYPQHMDYCNNCFKPEQKKCIKSEQKRCSRPETEMKFNCKCDCICNCDQKKPDCMFNNKCEKKYFKNKCEKECLQDFPIAMAYIPFQRFDDCELYPLEKGLNRGTIFNILDKPFGFIPNSRNERC